MAIKILGKKVIAQNIAAEDVVRLTGPLLPEGRDCENGTSVL